MSSTEIKHTPGPWRACNDGNCSCKTVSCGDHPIANVCSGPWGDDYPSIRLVGESSLNLKAEAYMAQATYGEIPVDVATANARLIAAAPDMHAMLWEIGTEISRLLHESFTSVPEATMRHWMDDIRTVTDKAEGRSVTSGDSNG